MALDPIKDYIKKLQSTNPELFVNDSIQSLMENVESGLNVSFHSQESFLKAVNSATGISLTEKKKPVQNAAPSGSPFTPGGDPSLSGSDRRASAVADYRDRERGRIKDNSIVSGIDVDFINRSEEEVRVDLEKRLMGRGFEIKESGIGNNLKIVSPKGEELEIDLGYSKKQTDRATNAIAGLFKEGPKGFVSGLMDPSSDESMFRLEQAKKLRDFISSNELDPTSKYQQRFNEMPYAGLFEAREDMVPTRPVTLSDGTTLPSTSIPDLNKKLSEINEKLEEIPMFVADKSTDVRSYVRMSKPKERQDLEKDKQQIIDAIKQTARNQSAFSKTAADLMNNSGQFDLAAAATDEAMQREIAQVSYALGIDMADMKLPQIKIDNNPVSFNEFKDFLTDYNLRESILNGDTSVSIDNVNAVGPIGALLKEAQELERVQLSGNMATRVPRNLSFGVAASAMETIANVSETILDVQSMLSELMLMPFIGKEKAKIIASINFDPKKDVLMSKARETAKAIRSEIPEFQGGITDSQSMSELFHKGGQAAADSAIITTTFMVNPAVGLTLTGLDSYGRNLNENREIMDYIAQTGDTQGLFPEYAGMTLGRARAISMSKAAIETGLTYAFTYNYLRGLSRSTSAVGDFSQNQLREQINFYSKGFYQRYSGLVGKAAIAEIPEENLIAVGQMFVDETLGFKEYKIDDYIKTIGDTSVSSLFTSLPLTTVSYNKMNNASKRTVHNLIARGMFDAKSIADQSNFIALDNEITQMKRDGKQVDQTLIQERDQLAKDIAESEDKYVKQIEDNATPKQIVQILKNEAAIAEKIMQSRRDDIGEASRKTFEKAAQDLMKQNSDIIESITNKKIFDEANASIEANKEITNPERPAPNKDTPDKGVMEAQSRDSADRIRIRMSEGGSDYFRNEENKQKIEESIAWLDNITYDSTTAWQREKISNLYQSLQQKDNPHVGFEQFYNTVIEADKYADRLLSENPTRERIDPFTKLEAPTMGVGLPGGSQGIWRMTDLNHVITIMFKNDRMASVVRGLSGRIDAKYSEAKTIVDGYRDSIRKLSFLEGKVDSKRRAAFNSDESQYERAFIAEAMKVDEDMTPEQAFQQTKKRMFDNIAKLKRHDNSENGKRRQKLWQDTYDRLFADSSNMGDVMSRANQDNIAAIKYMQELFAGEKDGVISHMQNYYGNKPTSFLNYLPTFYKALNSDGKPTETHNDYNDVFRGPSTMQETTGVTDLEATNKTMFVENWDELAMRALENSMAEVSLRGDLDALNGLVNSKKVEDIFDTEKRTTLTQKNSDFEIVRDLFVEKVDRIDKTIQSVGSSELMPADVVDETLKTIIKMSTALRLSTVSMRTSQATSAMLATSTIVGYDARGVINNYLVDFASGQLTSKLEENKGLNAVLAKSATGRRSGTESAAIVKQKAAKVNAETNLAKKGYVKVLSGLQSLSEKTLDISLGQSDAIAGKASFAALYYDRMLQKNPSKVKDMSMDEFWEWSENNIDMDAITWADSQISRAQMISMSWNQGKMFDPQNSLQKATAAILFPFGRFAYNRKVGMANDWSIISDKSVATEADKAMAKRRLLSAATEIAIFKTIQPAVGITLTGLFAKGISSLVGWDKEFDEEINMILNSKMPFSQEYDQAGLKGFKLTDYERDMFKEVYSSLAEGMIPTTMPSIVNEVIFSGANDAVSKLGMSEDPVFNVYSKDARDIFGEEPDVKNDAQVWEMFYNNSGMVKMALEDVVNINTAINAYNNGILPAKIGKDRYVTDQARPAVEFLLYARMINIIAPSADLKRFADKLQGKIERDYTSSVKPMYIIEKENKKEGDN